MPKQATVLTAKQLADKIDAARVEAARKGSPVLIAVGGVAGLTLRVQAEGAPYWLLRYRFGAPDILKGAPRKTAGIGSYARDGINLSKAREIAADMAAKIRNGIDPIAERERNKQAAIAAKATQTTLGECIAAFMQAKALKELRSDKSKAEWQGRFDKFVGPKWASIRINDFDQAHVLEILGQPLEEGGTLWADQNPTAEKMLGRLSRVLEFARVHGWRTTPGNPCTAETARAGLPAIKRVVVGHAALPWRDLPRLYADLSGRPGMAAKALRLALLTCTRQGEIRGASWGEIDLSARLWTIPANRTKTGTEYVIPLTPEAVAVLESLPRGGPGSLVFGDLSDAALKALMMRADAFDMKHGTGQGYRDPKQGGKLATPHGTARAGFTTWCQDVQVPFSTEVQEACLAHMQAGVRKHYARADFIEQRRELLGLYAAMLTSQRTTPDNVVPLRA